MFSLYFLFASSQSRNQKETQGEGKRGRGEERRGSGFSAALYPNPGFENRMRRTQVSTNTSNYSTDMELEGGGEELDGK